MNTQQTKKTSFIKRHDRLIMHTLCNSLSLVALWTYKDELKKTDLDLFLAFFFLAFYIVYYGGYLLERLAISQNHNKSHFYLIGKIISVLLNLSYAYALVYFVIFASDPDAITESTNIGTSFIERIFNFFYFSLGNFLGFDSAFQPQSFLFKFVQVLQSLTGFLLLVYLFTNFDTIKEQYSNYYKNED